MQWLILPIVCILCGMSIGKDFARFDATENPFRFRGEYYQCEPVEFTK